MPEKIFTGQTVEKSARGTLYFRCARCNSDNLIGSNSSAWWDTELKKYVHHDCLPVKQQAANKELMKGIYEPRIVSAIGTKERGLSAWR